MGGKPFCHPLAHPAPRPPTRPPRASHRAELVQPVEHLVSYVLVMPEFDRDRAAGAVTEDFMRVGEAPQACAAWRCGPTHSLTRGLQCCWPS
jgi:hypothetical protein